MPAMALTLKYKNRATGQVHSPEEVVDLFLDTQHDWWSLISATNPYYGQQDRYRLFFLNCLNGEENPSMPPDAKYLMDKFDDQWLPLFTVELIE